MRFFTKMKDMVNKVFRPRHMSQKEMEEWVDHFQEQYGVPEEELGDMFKNKDPKKWKI